MRKVRSPKKSRSLTKSAKSTNASARKLIVRPCTGNPTALLFLSKPELDDLRFVLDSIDLDLQPRLKKLYDGIKPEAEIEIEAPK